jgi:hypothetical protein
MCGLLVFDGKSLLILLLFMMVVDVDCFELKLFKLKMGFGLADFQESKAFKLLIFGFVVNPTKSDAGLNKLSYEEPIELLKKLIILSFSLSFLD